MSNKPVALVTCKIGSEDLCVEEIGNALYPYDNSVIVAKTKYRGLLIAYSRIDPVNTYRILSTKEYGFVRNIIPILAIIPLDKDRLFDTIRSVVRGVDCVKIKLRSRGIRGLTRSLWRGLVYTLENIGIKHDSKCPTCLFIEIIDENICIGLRECSR